MVRVVSLLPAATEIVAALGAADQLVGTSHECDYPAIVADRPRLTRSRITRSDGAAMDSAAIDAAVRRAAASGLSLYDLDVERLRSLAPDVVITQDLCAVCAVSLDEVQAALAELAGRSVRLVALSPTRLAHLFDDIAKVAAALGIEPAADRLNELLRGRLAELERRAAAAWSRPRVVTVEWLAPVMLGGTWMPELVALAGGVAVGVEAGQHAPSPTREELRALDAEVVVVKPCGYSLAQVLAERATIATALPLDAWPAGALQRVWLADGSSYFNRPGPRLVDSAELLAACLHPELFKDHAERYRDAYVRLSLP